MQLLFSILFNLISSATELNTEPYVLPPIKRWFVGGNHRVEESMRVGNPLSILWFGSLQEKKIGFERFYVRLMFLCVRD